MTPFWLVLFALAQALAWWAEPPRSLVDAAEREAIRRKIVGPSVGAYSNDTLSAVVEGVGGTVPKASEPDGRSQDAEPAPPERDEAWWRERVEALRGAIARDEARMREIDASIAGLDTQAVARDDPAQQAVLRQQANEARAGLDETRSSVAAVRRELDRVLEEARRASVPPGWLR